MHVSKTIRKIKFSYVSYDKILRSPYIKKYVHVNVPLHKLLLILLLLKLSKEENAVSKIFDLTVLV